MKPASPTYMQRNVPSPWQQRTQVQGSSHIPGPCRPTAPAMGKRGTESVTDTVWLFPAPSAVHSGGLLSSACDCLSQNGVLGVPIVVQQKRIRLGTMRFRVQPLASLSGLRIQCCRELWCRLQTRSSSCIAVAVVYVGGCTSD